MLAELIADLARVPALQGARCRHRELLFDQTTAQAPGDYFGDDLRYARKAAAKLCRSCPVMAQCDAWVESLPRPLRPRGIVGGRFTDEFGRRSDMGRGLRCDSKAWAERHNTPGKLSA